MNVDDRLRESLRRAGGRQDPPPGALTRFHYRRRRATVRRTAAYVAGIGVLLAVALTLPRLVSDPDATRPIRPGPASPSPSPSETGAAGEYFDGTIHGWRISTGEILEREGLGRNLELTCEAKQVGADTTTDLDFRLTYIPKDIGTPAHAPQVIKWTCGGMGLSVMHNMDWDDNPYDGLATLRVERALWGSRSRDLYAPKDLVEPCTIRGLPAVCVHYENDELGRGSGGKILIIEDDVFDPYSTVLLITDAGGIPFDELVKIAEGVR